MSVFSRNVEVQHLEVIIMVLKPNSQWRMQMIIQRTMKWWFLFYDQELVCNGVHLMHCILIASHVYSCHLLAEHLLWMETIPRPWWGVAAVWSPEHCGHVRRVAAAWSHPRWLQPWWRNCCCVGNLESLFGWDNESNGSCRKSPTNPPYHWTLGHVFRVCQEVLSQLINTLYSFRS